MFDHAQLMTDGSVFAQSVDTRQIASTKKFVKTYMLIVQRKDDQGNECVLALY